ncbi:phage tail protein I [Chromobacterium alticapitis]|uniref:Phage tail protein I n=1 Tax=Chromobacterium alticapitis TaxID=2073169 RepID=A0A2S5DB27_9NEIS|nr:phage tail protein I [Chromobacterium alticapitis]POZ60167.1 phage tail protein I [Chromobacterium alticapitis]
MIDTTPNLVAGDGRLAPIAELSRRFQQIALPPFLVYLIDNVQAEWLPALAAQLHVAGDEGWLLARSERQRRDLILQAIALHKRKGTRWAMSQVLATLGLNGRISEWFEYQGEPYRFRIDLDLSAGLPEDTYHALRRMLGQYGNARSLLEGLSLRYQRHDILPYLASTAEGGELASVYPFRIRQLEQRQAWYPVAAAGGAERATVYPYRQTRWQGGQPLAWGGAPLARETVTVYPFRPARFEGQSPLRWAAGLLCRETVTVPPFGFNAFSKTL